MNFSERCKWFWGQLTDYQKGWYSLAFGCLIALAIGSLLWLAQLLTRS